VNPTSDLLSGLSPD